MAVIYNAFLGCKVNPLETRQRLNNAIVMPSKHIFFM